MLNLIAGAGGTISSLRGGFVWLCGCQVAWAWDDFHCTTQSKSNWRVNNTYQYDDDDDVVVDDDISTNRRNITVYRDIVYRFICIYVCIYIYMYTRISKPVASPHSLNKSFLPFTSSLLSNEYIYIYFYIFIYVWHLRKFDRTSACECHLFFLRLRIFRLLKALHNLREVNKKFNVPLWTSNARGFCIGIWLYIKVYPQIQGTIGCTPNSVPMVFIVFSRDSWGL